MATVNVGPLPRIPLGQGRAFDVSGRAIAVFPTQGGELLATQALYLHRPGSLWDRLVGAGCMEAA